MVLGCAYKAQHACQEELGSNPGVDGLKTPATTGSKAHTPPPSGSTQAVPVAPASLPESDSASTNLLARPGHTAKANPAKANFHQPRQHINKQIHKFANKGLSGQSDGFSSGHVRM